MAKISTYENLYPISIIILAKDRMYHNQRQYVKNHQIVNCLVKNNTPAAAKHRGRICDQHACKLNKKHIQLSYKLFFIFIRKHITLC